MNRTGTQLALNHFMYVRYKVQNKDHNYQRLM